MEQRCLAPRTSDVSQRQLVLRNSETAQRRLVQQTSEAALVARPSEAGLPGALSTLPLSLFLSPNIPQDRAASLDELAREHPRYAHIVASEEGALCVLPEFELEEISALERRRCRVIGVPFAERLLRNPSSLEEVNALPLYDFILPPRTAVCFSGLLTPTKLRCSTLAKWMGARVSDMLDFNSGLLVTVRVSLIANGKYQEALARRIPVVKPSFLEASWSAKEYASTAHHSLPALQGLGVCIDPRHTDIMEKYRKRLEEAGAIMEALDNAEVVIVKDKFSPLYADAKAIGLATATPLWLDRCLELRCCTPISGELEVPTTQVSAFVAPGKNLGAFGDIEAFQKECNPALLGCVLCLLYLPEADRSYAKALAWKCAAFTTLDPHDRAITHVLLKNPGKAAVNVSIPVDSDRVSFLDIGWLEACVRSSKRLPERGFDHQQSVIYNPVCDLAHATILGRSVNSSTAAILGQTKRPTLEAKASVVSDSGLAPLADAAPQRNIGTEKTTIHPPTSSQGVFHRLRIGVFGQNIDRWIEKICASGGTAVRGSAEALVQTPLNVCVCFDECNPPPSILMQSDMKLATPSWLGACLADATAHSRSTFPHFKPCAGVLPMMDMHSCAIRVTGIEASPQSQRKRTRLEELIGLLGAKLATKNATWKEITHLVCVVPEYLDHKIYESACKRSIPVVTMKWLFDCYEMLERQPEDRYICKPVADTPASPPMASTPPVAVERSFAVLSSYHIFISPSTLGSNGRLPERATELGAKVTAWRSVDELQESLALLGIPPKASESAGTGTTCNDNVAVLVEKEELAAADSPLGKFLATLPTAHKGIFAVSSWLEETFSQRRCLPVEQFSALPPADSDGSAAKRQRTGEATYAWQSAGEAQLAELAEDSKTRAQQSMQQQKVIEGLRLAALHNKGPARPLARQAS